MAINQNFTTEAPALSLDFAKSRKLDSRITFTRSTARTYFNEKGLLVSADANVPRFNYAFSQSINLLNNTDNLSSWFKITTGGGSVTATDNNAGAPDGTSTATNITAVAGGTGAESIYQDIYARGNATYTASIFVKAGTQTSIVLAGFFINNTTQGFNTTFNPATGQITAGTGVVVPYPNGWYRLYFTFTGTIAANNYLRFQVYFQTSGTVSLWGPQMQEGSVILDYIANSFNQSNKPRSEGLIVEFSATNHSKYSQLFTDTWASGAGGSGTKYLTDTTVTSNFATAPDGTTTASRFVTSLTGGRITNYFNAAPGTTKNRQLCYSVFVKSNATSKIRLDLVCQVNSTDYAYRTTSNFYLSGKGSYTTPAITSSTDSQSTPYSFANIEPLFNGWYKCSISIVTYNGAGTLNGTLAEIRSPDAATDILIWGDQLEVNTSPTSYTATNGAAVSVGEDRASITGSGFTNTYNKYEGTFFSEFTPKGVNGIDYYGGIFGVSSQTDPAPFNFLILNPFGVYGIYTATRSQTITSNSLVGGYYSSINKVTKVAGSYAQNSFEACIDGIIGATSINLNTLVYDFDCYIIGRNFFTGNSTSSIVISKVIYYPRKLNGLQLKSLTQ